MKKQPLRVEIVVVPRYDALRNWDTALDIIADEIARDILERSRDEAAAELGLVRTDNAESNGIAEMARAHGMSLVGGDK